MKLVLSDKLRNESLTVLEDFSLESHRTKDFLGILENFKLDKKVLLMDDRENRNLYLSSRNVPGVKVVATGGLNVYDLLNCRHFLVTKRAILALQEVLQR